MKKWTPLILLLVLTGAIHAGSAGSVPKFSTASNLSNSIMTDDGSTVTIHGNITINGTFTSTNTASGSSPNYIQTVSTQTTSVHGTAWTTTTSSASITPSSLTAAIKITVASNVYTDPLFDSVYFTIFRNGSNLDAVSPGDTGMTQLIANTGQSIGGPFPLNWVDVPGTTAKTSYTVRMRQNGGTSTSLWNPNNAAVSMILEEVH